MSALTSYLDSLQKKIDAMKHWHDIAVKDKGHHPWWEDGPYPDMNILIAINRELLSASKSLLNKINKVTAPHRHHPMESITTKSLDELSNEQLRFEAAIEKCEKLCQGK